MFAQPLPHNHLGYLGSMLREEASDEEEAQQRIIDAFERAREQIGDPMTQQTSDLYIKPSDETIPLKASHGALFAQGGELQCALASKRDRYSGQ